VQAQGSRRAEAAQRRDPLDRLVGRFEQAAGQQQALVEQPAVGREPGGGAEPTQEGPLAHRGPPRQLADRERPIEVRHRPGQRVVEGVRLRRGQVIEL
jgi:hypothetical protein